MVVKGSQALDIIEPLTSLGWDSFPSAAPFGNADVTDADGKTPSRRKESKDIRNRESESNSDPFAP